MTVNEKKTKEMLIYFGTKHDTSSVPFITINNKQIERVESFKLISVVISADLSWENILIRPLYAEKVAKWIYCILYPVRAGIKSEDILIIYCSIIRSVLEYACQVWHPGLTKKQSSDIERVQKRCLRLIYPTLTTAKVFKCLDLKNLRQDVKLNH